jgi:hypothetical protein
VVGMLLFYSQVVYKVGEQSGCLAFSLLHFDFRMLSFRISNSSAHLSCHVFLLTDFVATKTWFGYLLN